MKDNAHIVYQEGKQMVGTPRFVSINTHKGVEQSRRDDLESLSYVLIYFLKGRLPWQVLELKDLAKQDRHDLIGRIKESTSVEELCAGLPEIFAEFLSYVKRLDFFEKPNYQLYIQKMNDLLLAIQIED